MRPQQEGGSLSASLGTGSHQKPGMLAPDSGVQLPGMRANELLLFRPPSLWCFVMGARAD